MNTEVPGADYETGLCNNRVFPVDTAALFAPSESEPTLLADLSYALYAFDLAGGGEFVTLTFECADAPSDSQDAWLGIADYGGNRWLWRELSLAGVMPCGDIRPFANAADEFVVAFMFSGTQARTINWVNLVPAVPAPPQSIFFLHHSTGAGLVFEGGMRAAIAQYNSDHSTAYEFWDHGYAGDGLTGPDGEPTGANYGPLTDFTDPPDLHNLWTSADPGWTALRQTILDNHDVIAFKSCFPASAIPDEDELNYRKQIYLAMRDFFDTRLDKLFVVVSTPPLHRLATTDTEADNARAFADWLKSPEYLDEHPNVVCFDLFDALAMPPAAETGWNRLRNNYEIDHEDSDSHPNTLANQTVGPQFAQFLCAAASAFSD